MNNALAPASSAIGLPQFDKDPAGLAALRLSDRNTTSLAFVSSA
jgi:hypothetical protein